MAHSTEIVGKYSEIVAEMALMANGYDVSRPTMTQPYDLKAEDPLNGREVKIQVKTIKRRIRNGIESLVVYARRNGNAYSHSEADLFIGVLVDDGVPPRVWMFENRGLKEYWSNENRAENRWVELTTSMDRSIIEVGVPAV